MRKYNLKEKINQMFIVGYERQETKSLYQLLQDGLGGIIFFTENIKEKIQIQNDIKNLVENSMIMPFLSIDQEGGRVERTENLYGKKKYLSAKYAYEKGLNYLETQTKQITNDLKELGFNMNFAPVLDVNSNPQNPIIGERAFSNKAIAVENAGKVVLQTYIRNGIIPVGKHFPGHGDTNTDSHLELPFVDLGLNELKDIHIRPFETAIKDNIPAIMISHVHYKCFDKEKTPATLSTSVLSYLQNELSFKGLVISDDMVMGALKDYDKFEACKKSIYAGMSMFIFRKIDKNLTNLLQKLEDFAQKNDDFAQKIDKNFEKIIKIKQKFNLF